MGKMTDEQVIRVLAEFMGIKHILDDLPDYLNSYDAVAEVLQKTWLHLSPRAHAYALAKAIMDAKEAPNATSE